MLAQGEWVFTQNEGETEVTGRLRKKCFRRAAFPQRLEAAVEGRRLRHE